MRPSHTHDPEHTVTLPHGPTVDVQVLRTLLALEARGVTITLTDEALLVQPAADVQPHEWAWLAQHRQAIRAIVSYVDAEGWRDQREAR